MCMHRDPEPSILDDIYIADKLSYFTAIARTFVYLATILRFGTHFHDISTKNGKYNGEDQHQFFLNIWTIDNLKTYLNIAFFIGQAYLIPKQGP